jgi:hypothetical protein
MVSLMTVLPPCVRRGCTRLADSSLRGCCLVHVIDAHILSAEHSSVGARSHICDILVSKGGGSVHNIHMCAECCRELDAMLSTREPHKRDAIACQQAITCEGTGGQAPTVWTHAVLRALYLARIHWDNWRRMGGRASGSREVYFHQVVFQSHAFEHACRLALSYDNRLNLQSAPSKHHNTATVGRVNVVEGCVVSGLQVSWPWVLHPL